MLAYHNDPAIKENGKCFDLVWYWRPRPAPGRVIDNFRPRRPADRRRFIWSTPWPKWPKTPTKWKRGEYWPFWPCFRAEIRT